MRYLKQFTFYPGERAASLVKDGCLDVRLCVDALWDALGLPGDTGCGLIEESEYDKKFNQLEDSRNKIGALEDKIGTLETKIGELLEDNRELETLCTRLEDENETLKEQVATLLEKLNGR